MLERRIREVFATLMSKGAKVLERTAGELAHAASELRQVDDGEDADRTWDEARQEEPPTIVRSAPLRAVPDTPTDEADDEGGAVITPSGAPWTPPTETPGMPGGEPDVTGVPSTPDQVERAPSDDDRIVELAAGTVSQIRPQLDDLSPDELRRLKEVELANRRRTTLIAAIDRALAERP